MLVPMFYTHWSLEKDVQRILRAATHGGMGCHWEQVGDL